MYVVALHIIHGSLRSCDQWPGYGNDWEKQIRLEGDTGDRSVNRLAGLVANKVRDFVYVSSCISASLTSLKEVQEHDPNVSNSVGTHTRWRIGSPADQISASDVLLLGILHVSDGTAMPILQVRDDFGTVFLA